MDDKQRGTVLMGAGYGFGAAGMVAPRLLASAFGIRDVSDEYVLLMRMFSARNVALGEAFRLVADDENLLGRFLTAAAATFTADTAAALLAAATGRVSWRAGLSLAATTATLAALSVRGASG